MSTVARDAVLARGASPGHRIYRPSREVRAVDPFTRTMTVVASDETVDRFGEVVRAAGWELANYLRNPVVPWAHDYSRPPVGRALDVRVVGRQLIATIQFADHPFADEVFRLYRDGYLHAVSVGFIPLEWHTEARDGRTVRVYDRQELLEISCVVVPANPDALVAIYRALSDGERLPELGDLSLARLPSWQFQDGIFVPVQRGVVPRDVSRETAPEDTPWEAPTLSDFTDEAWEDLSEAEKRRIAGHFAWAASMPPERFGDLKLPHHRPSDGKVVWRGVAAAMAALLGARGGVDIPDEDRPRVYEHLASHYRQFDKEPPELREALAPVQKVGRVLSRANEERIREAVRLLQEVLAQLEKEPEVEEPEAQEEEVRAGFEVEERVLAALRDALAAGASLARAIAAKIQQVHAGGD